jgi:hypothetical protein
MSAAAKGLPGPVQQGSETNRGRSTFPESSSPLQTLQPTAEEDIARLAYSLWEQRGRPDGSTEVDWFEAEQQLRRSR